jgi:hypothetical protein
VLLAAASAAGGAGVAVTGAPVPAGAAGSAPVWLCRPGAPSDPCAFSRSATAVPASGSRTTQPLRAIRAPKGRTRFDCFYVYPTVSTEKTANADLAVQPAETDVAIDQASLFSQVCTVWAPMYRQATLQDLAGLSAAGAGPTLATAEGVAYASLLSAWKYFLAHDAKGRPIVLIGHSQGAVALIHLIAQEIDPSPALRRRLVVAILAGGNLQVPTTKAVGATFAHVPLCTSAGQTACAIAWSSFSSEPPATSLFGRPGQGVSLQGAQTATAGQQVACVNPAALSGGTAALSPYFVSLLEKLTPPVSTTWVTFPGLYQATCEHRDGASWLQVSAAAGDPRPTVTETSGPTWGLHTWDVNLALGNLLADVAGAEAAWVGAHGAG